MSLRLLFATNPKSIFFVSVGIFFVILFAPLERFHSLHNFGLAISISVAIASFFAIIPNHINFAWLVVIGQASMAIYLSHTIVSALARSILFALQISEVFVHIILGILVGILVPLVAFRSIRDQRIIKAIGW